MTWIVRLPGGPDISSDAFTLGDLGDVEEEGGLPWAQATPVRSVKVARAFARAALRRAGRDPDDADTWTLAVWKGLFEFRPDDVDEDAGRPTKPRKKHRGRSTPPSSEPSPGATDGPPTSADGNA